MLILALPAMRLGTLSSNQWVSLQRRFIPWSNGSLVLLLITGLVQMTNDPNYNGFLAFDSLWAGALFIKHLAFAGMVVIGVYVQSALYPAMARTELLAEKRPELASDEQQALIVRESRLLRLNLICAAGVLFFTAVATAV